MKGQSQTRTVLHERSAGPCWGGQEQGQGQTLTCYCLMSLFTLLQAIQPVLRTKSLNVTVSIHPAAVDSFCEELLIPLLRLELSSIFDQSWLPPGLTKANACSAPDQRVYFIL